MKTEKYLESTENQLSSRGIFSRTHNSGKYPRDSDENDSSQNKSRRVQDRIIFMSMFNDIDRTKNGKYKECFSTSEKVKDFEK